MKTKFVVCALGAVFAAALTAEATSGWQLNGGVARLHDSWEEFDDDVKYSSDVDAGYISVGYRLPASENFYVIPEVRFAEGIGDDTVNYQAGYAEDYELDRFISGGLRTQWESEDGFYVFGRLSYTDAKLKYTVRDTGTATPAATTFDEVIETGEERVKEFGVGVGGGYYFTERLAAEISYEEFDGTDVLSLGMNFKF